MTAIVLALVLFQAGDQNSGAIMGIVRSAAGTPAVGVRVYAQQVRDTADANSPAAPLEGLTQTDAAGRYRLELPAGRYYIASGSVSAPTYPTGTTAIMPAFRAWPAVTDAKGRYRLNNVAPNTYQIVAGFIEAPAHHTGDPGSTTPKAITLASLKTIDALDIALPFPPARVGTTVRGRVMTKDGAPAVGSTVRIVKQLPPVFPISGISLPSITDVPEARVARDGTFEFSNVVPGTYNSQAFIGGVTQQRSFEVGNTPVTDLQFSLPTVVLSGQILLEDGKPVPDVELFGAGVLTTADNPSMILSRVLRLSTSGTFATEDLKGLLEHSEYRFHFLNNPAEYEIRSITAGALDLQRSNLRIDGSASIFVEARIAPRKGPDANSIRVTGTSFESASTFNVPSNGTRIYLCCRGPGNAERFSAPLLADGSFEFAGIPPGQYTVELQAKTGQLWVVGAMIEAKSDGVKLQLGSTTVRPIAPMVTIEIPDRP